MIHMIIPAFQFIAGGNLPGLLIECPNYKVVSKTDVFDTAHNQNRLDVFGNLELRNTKKVWVLVQIRPSKTIASKWWH